MLISVPSEKPRIFVDGNREVRLKLGPYRIGETVRIRCDALGGRPQPVVTWWRDHALMDDSYQMLGGYKVTNELVIDNLKRSDLHSILTCQAANNNISVPVSTSVKLDMNCKQKKITGGSKANHRWRHKSIVYCHFFSEYSVICVDNLY